MTADEIIKKAFYILENEKKECFISRRIFREEEYIWLISKELIIELELNLKRWGFRYHPQKDNEELYGIKIKTDYETKDTIKLFREAGK